MRRTSIQCGCGRIHTDLSALTKVGWQADGTGGAALLVNCQCQSTLVAERMVDACLCSACHRLVTGADGDVKTCAWGERGHIVLCGGCFRRDPRRAQWLQWHESSTLVPRLQHALHLGWPSKPAKAGGRDK